MTNWLLTHQATLQSYLVLGSFVFAAAWESFVPRRPFTVPLARRWVNQLALTALGSLLMRLCLPMAAFSMAMLAQQEGWGLGNQIDLPPWLALVAGVLLLDLGSYAQHRLLHAVPLFWRFHQVHHCDLDVDCGTAIRHHPIEIVGGQAFELALIAALGIAPLAVVVALALGGVAAIFNHANVRLSTRADRVLRTLIVTPAMHGVHHSADFDESNRNFANLFSFWDRLFATYQRMPRSDPLPMRVGLAELRGDADLTLWGLLALPFRSPRVAACAELDPLRPNASP